MLPLPRDNYIHTLPQNVLKNAQPQMAEETRPMTTMSPPWTTIARLDKRQMPESSR